ncbi:MAG: sigma-70 family RNA polymerase sigma factor [Bacteroidetes bacterium]|nr:sigma-70 family RNA polymerase sigma factor [Bacteroidia bacterium]MBN8695721.1 sigma-70 family RNA polymerase sigma factor [Bacteroidota bacterium]
MDELEFDSNLSEKAVYDYNLIRAALDKGDQKAYAELMGRYRDSVYFMLLKMVNNKDDADDLTIEAFGKAFKRLQQYTPNYAFSTWLFKIASNNAIDFIRRKKMVTFSIDKTFEDEEGSSMAMDIKASGLTPEENMEKKQKIVHMRAVVDKLKPRYKVLVEMRYFEELSYEEIAEKLDLPLGTVKAQLFRAREFLANILKNSEGKI